ncbi:MAG: hypothetical protein ABJA82_00500 [Myxococcales bacterium]
MTQQELEAHCATIGRAVGNALKDVMPEGVGFALVMFDFGPGGSLAYCSSAQREDMIKVLAEMRETLLKRTQ